MNNVFLGAVPLKPSVDQLMQEINPSPGEVYSHKDLSRICGADYPSMRYRSVIACWKRRLIVERGIDVVAEPKIGYRVLLDGERVSSGAKEATSGLRKIRRGGSRAMRAEESNLTEPEKRQRMQLMRTVADLAKIGHDGLHEFNVLGKVTQIEKRND